MSPRKTQLGWGLIILLWLPMLALLVWGKGGIVDLLALRRQVRELEQEVQRIRDENTALKVQIQKLQTDPSLYEELARERLFLKKPGEVVVYLPGEEGAGPAPAKAAEGTPAKSPAPAP